MSELSKVMADAAIEGSRVVLEVYRRGADARTKGDGSPVTEADERGEEAILSHLKEFAGDIPVIAEESVAGGQVPKAHERFFLVDPLDGTKEFVTGTDEFTVNIALIENGVPTMGVVTVPALGKLFVGIAGEGATLQMIDFETGNAQSAPDAISVRARPESGAVAMTSRSHGSEETQKMLERLGVTDVMPAGSSLKFCAIAEGKADLYPRLGRTMEWDTAAAHAVLKAAGGEVYVFDDQERGAPLSYGKEDRGFDNPHFLAVGGE
ncbi:3'(2'),5'-bisphosphate nucleotidase CysQ [Parvularcula sp. ZS-1/3]|uniref:3'(2'),5'-bisphosphate nucleotidase CysQ n=1 Tax=Parvularcula mediterranea TaxID=2732508 RepID=A0A7Y3RM22_9PROT|nr:3'(2'),5'-bisphosphate nucleotidase CysQ [Parvularcula mediterranea]NNU16588.1 3'(2'),5'-bisphosphate nucleotidase CysQ [Parvularcula mediterranea]